MLALLLLLLLLTKHLHLYHACDCALEYMCILHVLSLNLLDCRKMVSPPSLNC